jgi:hypothetical protein
MSGHPDFPQPQHRQLTKEEADALRHRAFECERRVKAAIAQLHEDKWALAEALYEFHQERYWELLGGYETLNEFLAQPEIGLRRSTYFRLVQVWRDFVEVKRVEPARLRQIEPSKAYVVLPAVMRGNVKVEDALNDAEALGWRDLREEYRRGKSQRETLAAEDEPARRRCPVCGGWTTEDVIEGTAREKGS